MPNGLHLHVLFIRQSSGTEGKFPTGKRVIYRCWYLRRRLKGFISDIYYLFIYFDSGHETQGLVLATQALQPWDTIFIFFVLC